MTAILGFACLVLIMLSACNCRIMAWAVLLSLTWLAGFAEPWTYPLMNALAFVSAIALISINKETYSGFAGLVTFVFPVMLALDVAYSLSGRELAWLYYWSLIDLFILQLLAVGWQAVLCWRDRFAHLKGGIHFHAFRISGRDECRVAI